MPAATARASTACRVASSAVIRIPPVTPAPNAISEIFRPVRPRGLVFMATVSSDNLPCDGGTPWGVKHDEPSRPVLTFIDVESRYRHALQISRVARARFFRRDRASAARAGGQRCCQGDGRRLGTLQ